MTAKKTTGRSREADAPPARGRKRGMTAAQAAGNRPAVSSGRKNAPPDTAPPVSDDPQALADDIKHTRERLGEAVEELTTKTDVKARARDKAAQISGHVQAAAAQAMHQTKERSSELGAQLAATTPTARQALPVAGAGIVTGSLAGVLTYLVIRRRGPR